MRLILNEKAAKKIEKLRQDYASRGLKTELWMSIVSDAICTIPTATWISLVDKNTPQEIILKEAMQDPKMQKEFLEFMKTRAKPSDHNIENSSAFES